MRATLGDGAESGKCNAASEGCVAEVNLILTVDFRGSILEVDCCGLPR